MMPDVWCCALSGLMVLFMLSWYVPFGIERDGVLRYGLSRAERISVVFMALGIDISRS